MLKTFRSALSIVSQLFRSKPTEYISNSGKGDKEVVGRFVRLEKTVRGLTVVVHNGETEKRVSWRMSEHTADYVMRLTVGATLHVPSHHLRELDDTGNETLGQFLSWCDLFKLIIWERSQNTVRLADDCIVNG